MGAGQEIGIGRVTNFEDMKLIDVFGGAFEEAIAEMQKTAGPDFAHAKVRWGVDDEVVTEPVSLNAKKASELVGKVIDTVVPYLSREGLTHLLLNSKEFQKSVRRALTNNLRGDMEDLVAKTDVLLMKAVGERLKVIDTPRATAIPDIARIGDKTFGKVDALMGGDWSKIAKKARRAAGFDPTATHDDIGGAEVDPEELRKAREAMDMAIDEGSADAIAGMEAGNWSKERDAALREMEEGEE